VLLSEADLAVDRMEMKDLAGKQPERVEKMVTMWQG
jgi:hypothetical protein